MTKLADMSKEVAQIWIDALESGGYKQTIGCLRNDEGFCCLGVLQDLGLKHGVTDYLKPDAYAPDNNVVNWAFPGIAPHETDDDPNWGSNEYVFVDSKGHYLTTYNDVEGLNFIQIAAIIRNEVGL